MKLYQACPQDEADITEKKIYDFLVTCPDDFILISSPEDDTEHVSPPPSSSDQQQRDGGDCDKEAGAEAQYQG